MVVVVIRMGKNIKVDGILQCLEEDWTWSVLTRQLSGTLCEKIKV